MQGVSAFLPWVILALALLPGAALTASAKERWKPGSWPMIGLVMASAAALPILAAWLAETYAAPGSKILEVLPFLAGAAAVTAAGLLHQASREDLSMDAALAGCGALVLVFMAGQVGPLAARTALSGLLGMGAAAAGWTFLGAGRAMLQASFAGGMLLPAAALAAFWKQGDVRTGVLLAAALLVGASLVSMLKIKDKPLAPLFSCLIFVAAAGAVAAASGGSLTGKAMTIASVSGILALVLDYAVPKESGRQALASVLWLAGAGFAFSLLSGLGVALMGFCGAGALLLLQRADLLASLAPLAAMALYRVFRESAEGAVKAFDIGQHYTMIGLFLGVFAVEAVAQLLKGAACDRPLVWLRGLAGAAALFFLLAGGALILQDRGLIGLVIGTGLAAGVGMMKDRASGLASAALGLSSSTFLVLAFRAILPAFSVAKEEKQAVLIAFAVGAALSLAALVLLARPNTEDKNHEASLA